MEWLKKHKNPIIISAVIILSLTAAFIFSEQPNNNIQTADTVSSIDSITSITSNDYSLPSEKSELLEISENTEVSQESLHTSNPTSSETVTSKPSEKSANHSVSSSVQSSRQTEQSAVAEISRQEETTVVEIPQEPETPTETVSVPNNTESKVQNTNSVISSEPSQPQPQITPSEPDSQNICTLSISCQTAVNNSSLTPSKQSIVPSDGWILHDTTIHFNEGESVFDVTKRFCMEQKIPFEFSITPIYNSAYVEGINNLYQFDCGSASGWVYSVNGEFANYSCSEYQLKSGDKIEWHYTCNLGKDVGNEYQGG